MLAVSAGYVEPPRPACSPGSPAGEPGTGTGIAPGRDRRRDGPAERLAKARGAVSRRPGVGDRRGVPGTTPFPLVGPRPGQPRGGVPFAVSPEVRQNHSPP